MDGISNENLDFAKTKIKDAAPTSFRNYNANLPRNFSDEEFKALQNLSKNTNEVIQKFRNSVVILDKDIYIKHMESLLSNKAKFEEVDTKKDLLNFTVNHEKRLNEYLKSLKASGVLSVEQDNKIKAVGSRPGVLYGLCKVHKNIVDRCPLFRPILSAIKTPSDKIAKFLVPRMISITYNEITGKDTFCFAKEVVEQDSSLVMASLDVDSLFTIIPLDKAINIFTNTVHSKQDVIQGISKEEFRNLLSLATKESYLIFSEALYKQKVGVAMGSPLGPTLANAFLRFYEKKWLEKCPPEFKPVFYRRCVDYIFVLFKSTDHLVKYRNYFHTCHPNMSFSFAEEKNGKMPFLDVQISRGNGKIVTTVYHKPTFSGIYTHFESFLPSTQKFGMLYTLVHRCFT